MFLGLGLGAFAANKDKRGGIHHRVITSINPGCGTSNIGDVNFVDEANKAKELRSCTKTCMQ